MTCFDAQPTGDSIHNPAIPTHFMWVKPVGRRVSVYFENLVIAVTSDALRVIEVGADVYEPVLYLPKNDICAQLSATQKQSHCPLKGDASHFDLVDPCGVAVVSDAAWMYPDPLECAGLLKQRVAFDHARFVVEIAPT